MRDTLDAAAVRRWCATGLAALRRHEREINELNVYPVPDGDTGTNLALTMASAQRALADTPADTVGAVLPVMARGALLGARGNSGVIVSQLLRGLADALQGTTRVGAGEFAAAWGAAVRAGYAAVAQPVEGTILSVASAAARGAAAQASDGLVTTVEAAARHAAQALLLTPSQLPALAAANVVDAGGRGLVVLLDALVEVVTGERPQHPRPPLPARPEPTAVREVGSAEYAYEVQYLLDADNAAVHELRSRLSLLGDSLVVVGTGDGLWHVHVHVNDVGAAIEAGIAAGRPSQLTVTRFDEPPRYDPGARGAVVVASGDGLMTLFAAEGAVVVEAAPSTAEVLAAIRGTGAGQVVVLPNDPDVQAVAAAAADEAADADLHVRVVPTRSPVQALAALAVRDPQRRFDDEVIAMAEAAGACRYAEVCFAARDALTVVGRCQAGDVLALVEGEVHVIGRDVWQVCQQLLDGMLGGGGELVTLLLGAEAPDGLGRRLAAYLAARWPLVEVQVHHGGQPTYPLLVGVE